MANDVVITVSGKDRASPVFKGVENNASSMGSKIGSIAKTAAIGFAAIGVAAGAMGVVSVRAASNLGESVNKASETFKEHIGIVTAFAATSAASFGISKRAAKEYAGTIGTILNASGLARAESSKMSVSIVKLAADLASFNNISIDEALQKLRAGLVGEAEPLRTVGVLLSETAVKSKAVEMGLAGVKDELTDGQKVQARYALILEQTAAQQGDFARTSDGLANSQRILSARFEDLQANIGTKLLPVAVKLFGLLNDGIGTVERFGHVLTAGFTNTDVLGGASEMELRFFKVGRAIAGIVEFVQTEFIPRMQAFFAWLQPKLAELGAWVAIEFGKFRLYWESDIKPAFDNIRDAVTTTVAWIKEHWPEIERVIRPIMEEVLNVVTTTFNAIRLTIAIILDIIQGDWSGAWENMKALVGTIFNGIKESLENQLQLIVGIVRGLGEALLPLAGDFFNWGWELGKQAAEGMLNAIKGKMGEVRDFLNPFNSPPGFHEMPLMYNRFGQELGEQMGAGIFDGLFNSPSMRDIIAGTIGAFKLGGGGAPGGIPGFTHTYPSGESVFISPTGQGPPGSTARVITPEEFNAGGGIFSPNGLFAGGNVPFDNPNPAGFGVTVNGNVYGFDDFRQKVAEATRDAALGGAFRGVLSTP